VQAMVGGLDYSKSQYNRAAQAKRQPGSSFKLFVYLAALEAGLTPLSTVEDAPISIQVGNKTWSPENFEVGGYRGQIPMVEAIRYSLNTVSVRLSQYTGIGRVADLAMRLGVPNIPSHPSIALGAVEATLLEMTGAYAHLPNGGNKVVPYGILRIRTRDGKEIYKREAPEPVQLLGKGVVEMMNYMLVDVATRGTGAKAALPGRQVGGKTGTSQDYKDAWFIGFTGNLVTGVWIGNDDNKSMKKVTGGSIPATIWHDFMIKALEGKPVKGIPTSAGSSEGLLPWLFGGAQPAEQDGSAPVAPAPGVSDASPFGLENNGNAPLPVSPPAGEAVPAGAAPAPQFDVPVEQPANAPPAPATNGEAQAQGQPADGEVLSPQFWDKLMKKAPTIDKSKIEYSYPR
jgi:penicillin-binding protein 1A